MRLQNSAYEILSLFSTPFSCAAQVLDDDVELLVSEELSLEELDESSEESEVDESAGNDDESEDEDDDEDPLIAIVNFGDDLRPEVLLVCSLLATEIGVTAAGAIGAGAPWPAADEVSFAGSFIGSIANSELIRLSVTIDNALCLYILIP